MDQLGAGGLRDGSLAVNAPGAWLHNIEGEAYAVSPACFEAFAAGRDLATATVRHRVVRLRRHRQREARSGAANLFRAVLADGSRVKGMVFPGELVWDDDPPPRGNARLVGKAGEPVTAAALGPHPVHALTRPRVCRGTMRPAKRRRRGARDRDRSPPSRGRRQRSGKRAAPPVFTAAQGQRSPRLNVTASKGRMQTGSSSLALAIGAHRPS